MLAPVGVSQASKAPTEVIEGWEKSHLTTTSAIAPHKLRTGSHPEHDWTHQRVAKYTVQQVINFGNRNPFIFLGIGSYFTTPKPYPKKVKQKPRFRPRKFWILILLIKTDLWTQTHSYCDCEINESQNKP